MNEINKALEVLKDDSKPRNRADLLRVLTEWNRATGVFVVSGSWFYEVQGMLEDAFDCGAALAASQFTPLAWVHEDELPEGFPYEQLFPYSKVDIVRMFPIFGPSAGQCGESCERAKLCGACARGLEEVPEPAASEREAFEAWARDQWGDRPVPNNAWLGWQGRAALAASQPAPVDGWKLVPAEPTNAMVKAALFAEGGFRATYRAILAAAPAPTSVEDGIPGGGGIVVKVWPALPDVTVEAQAASDNKAFEKGYAQGRADQQQIQEARSRQAAVAWQCQIGPDAWGSPFTSERAMNGLLNDGKTVRALGVIDAAMSASNQNGGE